MGWGCGALEMPSSINGFDLSLGGRAISFEDLSTVWSATSDSGFVYMLSHDRGAELSVMIELYPPTVCIFDPSVAE